MKTLLQLSSPVLLLATSLIAEVIPTANEVQSVSIKITYGKDTSGIRFKANAGDWKEIRSQMLPARIDPNPALWEGLADATIIKKDGQSLSVTLWIPATGQGAFSVGGKYYRGGDSSKIMKAILDAHQKSMKRHEGEKNSKAQQNGADHAALVAPLAVAKNDGGWSANSPTDQDMILPREAVNALLSTPWLIKYYHSANPIRLQARFVPKDAKLSVDKIRVAVDEAPRKPRENFARLEITAVEQVSILDGYAVSFRYPSEGVTGSLILVPDGDSWRVVSVSGGEI